jgi:serine protease Do
VLKDLAKQLGWAEGVGFRVTRVYPGTNAEKAGLRVGDIITKLDEAVMSPRGMQDAGMFQREVRKLSTGGTARLSVLRDGKPAATIEVPLERTRLTQEEARRDTNRDFELTVRELTFFDTDDNRWSDGVQGVIVQSVERVGWAGLAGVFERDLIQSVNGENVTDLASYRRAMERVAREQPPRVTFVILRGTRTQFMFAEPEWKPTAPDIKK